MDCISCGMPWGPPHARSKSSRLGKKTIEYRGLAIGIPLWFGWESQDLRVGVSNPHLQPSEFHEVSEISISMTGLHVDLS